MRRRKIGRLLSHLLRNESGATAIEYALIACGISIAIVGSVTTLGSNIMTMFYDKLSTLF